MSRKGLAGSSVGSSPRPPSVPSSPNKLAAQPEFFTSPKIVEAPPTGLVTTVHQGRAQKSSCRQSIRHPEQAYPQGFHQLERLSDPKAEAPASTLPARPPSYPLQHEWTLFFDTRSAGPSTPGLTPTIDSPHPPLTPTLSTSSWEANLRTIGTYSAVETFLPCFSKLRRPSQLDRHSSYHVFKDGIKPMWEDPRNAKAASGRSPFDYAIRRSSIEAGCGWCSG